MFRINNEPERCDVVGNETNGVGCSAVSVTPNRHAKRDGVAVIFDEFLAFSDDSFFLNSPFDINMFLYKNDFFAEIINMYLPSGFSA